MTARHSHTTNCLAITSSTVCMYARRAASYYSKVQCGVDISTSAVARAEHEAVSSGLPLRSAHATTYKTRSWPVGMLGLYALLLHENRTYSFLLVLHSPWQVQTQDSRDHPAATKAGFVIKWAYLNELIRLHVIRMRPPAWL